MAVCVPAVASIVAGLNLERIRTSPLRQQLPPAALAFLEPLGGARSVLVASDGVSYLVLTRGDFRQAPPGTTLLGRGLAVAGSPDWLRSAASHGSAVVNGLVARAGPVATADIWIAAAGGAQLPVSGNGENFNRLLHETEYTTLAVRLADTLTIDVTGFCRGPDPARHLEETVRAMVSLGAAATARQPAVSGLLRRIRVTRNDQAVQLTLVVDAAELETVFRLLSIGG
jgi:hypothetical protein